MEFNWEKPEGMKNTTPTHGDIRIVNLPVEVVCVWEENIPCDWDEEGNVLETKSGFLMKVLDNQVFQYKGQESVKIANAYIESND